MTGGSSWLKDGFGIFLVVLSGMLYMAGVTEADPRPEQPSQEVVQTATAAPAPTPSAGPGGSAI